MLATASPLPKSSSLPAPHASLAAAHGSPGDSDFECSDDEPALAMLRDELRTTTEKFFEREPGHPVGVGGGGGGRGGGHAGERRRAYSVLTPKLPSGGAPKQQKSWNALNDLEKGVEGLIRRSASPGFRVCDRGNSDSLLMADGGGRAALGTAPPSQTVKEGGETDSGGGGGGSGGRGKDEGGGIVSEVFRGADLNGSGCAKVPSSGTGGDVDVPADPHLSLAYAKTQRWLNTPCTEEISFNAPNSSPMREDEFGNDSTPRPPPQPPLGYPRDAGSSADSEVAQEDLQARSEEATRTLEALKVLLVEEGRHGEAAAEDDGGSGNVNGDRDSGVQGRRTPSKLWPTRGAKRPAPGGFARQHPDAIALSGAASRVPATPGTPRMAASGGGAGNSGSGDVSNHVPQLLQAMDDLQSINAELIKALKSTPLNESDRGHRRLGSSSTPRSQQQRRRQEQEQQHQGPQRPGPGPRQRSARMQSSGLLARQSRSSSELLRRRHTQRGQAEPMSCGVPRHRVQVCKQGDDVVFFELAITQAKSTWTLERRMDEFLELRRSLVATATDLAASELAAPAAAATAAEDLATASQEGRGGPASCGAPRDAERKRKSASNLDAVDGIVGVRGPTTTGGRRDGLREGEARVPELPCEYSGKWFGTSRLWSLVSARKREEKMMEKQVLLASWLANVLADRELMSPDLVRFLGGDYGGMVAQPVVADVVDDACDDHNRVGGGRGGGLAADDRSGGGHAGLFEVSDDDCATVDDSDDDSDEEDDSDEDGVNDSEDDLTGELDSLRGSLCAPDEWALEVTAGVAGGIDSGGSDARFRLEKAMGKRVALARAGPRSPMFPVGGAVLPLEAMRDSRRVGGVAGSERNLGARGAERTELDLEGGGVGGGDVTVRSFSETFSPSLADRRSFADVPKERRQSGPSPSSPSRRVTLDVFFRVPT